MWQVTIGRQQLIELLQRDRLESSQDVREIEKEGRLRQGDIRLLWATKPRAGELPNALVIREVEVDEFLAWTNTYLSNWCPITAYFRVLSDSQALLEGGQLSEEGTSFLESASVGLIVAEAIAQAVEAYDVDRVSMAGCIATFSFAAAQGLRRNVTIADVAHNWSKCRKITGQAPLRVKVESLTTPWEAVNELARGDLEGVRRASSTSFHRWIVEGLREFIAAGEIGAATWNRLTVRFPKAREAIEPMKGTQEERVAVLESVLAEKLDRGHRTSEATSFVVGYLVSRIFPGTIKHVGLLLKHLENFPSAVLWLGLFASLHGRRELSLTGLGRRVWRALSAEDSVLSRPRCDIALRELLVLIEGGAFGAQYKTETPGRLAVELHPCVETVVRWPTHELAREAHRQGELFRDRAIELGDLARDLREIRNQLDKVTKKLEGLAHLQN